MTANVVFERREGVSGEILPQTASATMDCTRS